MIILIIIGEQMAYTNNGLSICRRKVKNVTFQGRQLTISWYGLEAVEPLMLVCESGDMEEDDVVPMIGFN